MEELAAGRGVAGAVRGDVARLPGVVPAGGRGRAARPRRPAGAALARHMPELVPDVRAARASWPAATSWPRGCSRSTGRRASSSAARRARGRATRRCWSATTTTRPSRLEGIVYLTAWNGRRVLGMSDCLWGLLDGDQRRGPRRLADVRRAAATSATASRSRSSSATCWRRAPRSPRRAPRSRGSPCTRRRTSRCSTARATFLTAYVGPGRPPAFPAIAATTNHQGEVEWPEYARGDPHRGARALRARPARGPRARPRAVRRRVPRAAAAQHALRARVRDDLHRRLSPRRGPGGVPLARRHVGAVARPLLPEGAAPCGCPPRTRRSD